MCHAVPAVLHGPYGGGYPVQEHALEAWIKAAGALLLLARFLRVAVLAVLEC